MWFFPSIPKTLSTLQLLDLLLKHKSSSGNTLRQPAQTEVLWSWGSHQRRAESFPSQQDLNTRTGRWAQPPILELAVKKLCLRGSSDPAWVLPAGPVPTLTWRWVTPIECERPGAGNSHVQNLDILPIPGSAGLITLLGGALVWYPLSREPSHLCSPKGGSAPKTRGHPSIRLQGEPLSSTGL